MEPISKIYLFKDTDLIGSIFVFRRNFSLVGTACQWYIKPQSKPPTWIESIGVACIWKVLSSIGSITGTVDTFEFRAIGSINGSVN